VKIVLSKVRAKKSEAQNEKPLKVSITLYGDSSKGINAGKKIYFYVQEDGQLSLAGLFPNGVDASVYDFSNENLFKDRSTSVFNISKELDKLKGSRIDPTYLEINRVEKGSNGNLVSGLLHNAYDPRLTHLDRSEKTEFGEGKFKLDDVVAFYDGTYFNLVLSPMATKIESIVNQQRTAFIDFESAESESKEKEKAKRVIDYTASLLKPHAYEIFKIKDDMVYFVTKSGKWQAFNIAGHRKIDLWDKQRIYEHITKEQIKDTRSIKENFHSKSIKDRFLLKDLAPIFADEVLSSRENDKQELETIIKKSESIKPSDGLEPIEGIKEGVELLPHQAYIIAKTKDRDRLPIDVDPGGGKTLCIIADALNQLKEDKAKRPLVVVPNSLVSQFAAEVRRFSDLNPWVINTQSLKRWKDGKLETMIADAKKAPSNTIFITSYNWLAAEKSEVENGKVIEKDGKRVYQTTQTYPRSYALLNEIGIDAVYLDEVHTLKNESHFTKAANILAKVKQVKGFTGTLMPGNLVDVLGPMGVIHSAVLETPTDFVSKYSPTKSINSYHKDAPKEIRSKLKNFGMPQVRNTVWSTLLPKLHRKYHYVNFDANQQKYFDKLLDNTIDDIRNDPSLKRAFEKFTLSLEEDEPIVSKSLLDRFSTLETFVNAPAEAKSFLRDILTGDAAISPKMKIINDIVSKHLSDVNNGKVIIFCQYEKSAQAIYENLASNLKSKAAMYKGGMVDVLSQFKNEESNLKILVGVDATLRIGHNLQVANCIIHADTLWMSGDMRQREARARRLKQPREVYVHHVLVKGSHELLKNARILSQEHTIAKANSDFEDETMLPHVEMTLKGMRDFRAVEKIEPFVSRQEKLETFAEKQTEKDKEFFGTRVMAPTRYEALSKGKKLAVVPSTDVFEGDFNDSKYIIEEELEEMKWEDKPPTLLKFNFQNTNNRWFLTAFKTSDPNGFVRRLGFLLQPPYYYIEVSAKGSISSIIDDIESADIEIIDKDVLLSGISRSPITKGATKGILKQLEQRSRQVTSAKEEALKYQVNLDFSTVDGYPLIVTKNVKIGSKEGSILKRKGFKEGISYWYLPITRTRLLDLFKKLQHQYPDVRIADWDNFKKLSNTLFKVDIKDFDELGEKV